MVNKKYTKNQY